MTILLLLRTAAGVRNAAAVLLPTDCPSIGRSSTNRRLIWSDQQRKRWGGLFLSNQIHTTWSWVFPILSSCWFHRLSACTCDIWPFWGFQSFEHDWCQMSKALGQEVRIPKDLGVPGQSQTIGFAIAEFLLPRLGAIGRNTVDGCEILQQTDSWDPINPINKGNHGINHLSRCRISSIHISCDLQGANDCKWHSTLLTAKRCFYMMNFRVAAVHLHYPPLWVHQSSEIRGAKTQPMTLTPKTTPEALSQALTPPGRTVVDLVAFLWVRPKFWAVRLGWDIPVGSTGNHCVYLEDHPT